MCLSCSKVYIFIISLKTIQNFSVEVTPLTQLASPFLGIHARLYYFLTLTFYVYTISTMLIMCPSSSNSSIPSLAPSYHKYSGLSNLETCSLSPFPCMAIFEEKTWSATFPIQALFFTEYEFLPDSATEKHQVYFQWHWPGTTDFSELNLFAILNLIMYFSKSDFGFPICVWPHSSWI